MMRNLMKWLRNPMQQFLIKFLNAPHEDHPDWADPEVRKKVQRFNFMIWFFLSFIVLMILLLIFSSLRAHAFSIRTNPPIQMNNFICECNLENCFCKQGEITLTLVYNQQRREEWEKWASQHKVKGIFGWEEPVCQEACIAYISDVVLVKLPYLSFSTLESAERAASLSLKKSMSITEKASSMISALLQSVGIQTSSDESSAILREKVLSTLKKQAENQNIDITTYIITDMLRMLGYPDPRPPHYFNFINHLTSLAKENKLQQFLALYFLAKANPQFLYLYTLNIKDPVKLQEYTTIRKKILEKYPECIGKKPYECYRLISALTNATNEIRLMVTTRAIVEIYRFANATDNATTDEILKTSWASEVDPNSLEWQKSLHQVEGYEGAFRNIENYIVEKQLKEIQTSIQRDFSFLQHKELEKAQKTISSISKAEVKVKETEKAEKKDKDGSGFWKGFILALMLLVVSYLFYILYRKKKKSQKEV